MLVRASCPLHNLAVVDTAQLLVSELVSNPVLHGAPPITVHISCVGDAGLQVQVGDTNRQPPALADADPETNTAAVSR
jgi:hypothetical protein